MNKKDNTNRMHRVTVINIDRSHPLFDYCDSVSALANNLYNVSLYHIRQVFSGVRKDPENRFQNEIEVLKAIEETLPKMQARNKKFKMPTEKRPTLSYQFLDAFLKFSNNPDYYAEGLPAHARQYSIRNASSDIWNFFSAIRKYKKDPSSFLGRPKIPRYRDKGGHCTFTMSNQECHYVNGDNGHRYLKLPLLDELLLEIPKDLQGTLSEVKVTPYYDIYRVSIITDIGEKPSLKEEKPTRIIAIDLGVSNFAAITNNIGAPCLLFKGGVLKSVNQWYNKRMSIIVSEQTKGTTKKFAPTPESKALCMDRDNKMRDFMHKTANYIISWCETNKIDTIVIGENKGWKQDSDMNRFCNQEFVGLPFNMFKAFLEYRAVAIGIRVVRQEESYTSRASFLNKDPIPVFGEDGADKVKFSGTRGPSTYRGNHRPNNGSIRGIYKIKGEKKYINSDLNGSANILRKAFPHAFDDGIEPNFNDVVIIVHPDYASMIALKKRQCEKNANKEMSKAKKKRLAKKTAIS